MKKRGSGILLHISSLPSPFGIGDLGPQAYEFADFLYRAKQSYWQILPLNPTDLLHDNSPYRSISAFAFNPLLISPDLLVKEDLLTRDDLEPIPRFHKGRVDYEKITEYKIRLFDIAYDRFKQRKETKDYQSFCTGHSYWLDDFALFQALKSHYDGEVWSDWPVGVRDRDTDALKPLAVTLQDQIDKAKFLQYIFMKQWLDLKDFCQERGIEFIGDIPIYVAYDSVDVWTHPRLFKLDGDKKPLFISGVPPDYFSKTGQLWYNPVYRWDILQETKYAWWIERIRHNIRLFDYVRIDHFRGLVAYWQVPAGEKTAINGEWIEAPAMDFLDHVHHVFPDLPIIAEDLGVITSDVEEVMERFDIPGMRVLLFGFSGDLSKNVHLPHNLNKKSVLFTGTHDNNTIRGWFKNDATEKEKKQLYHYFGRKIPIRKLHWELIHLAMVSVAEVVIFSMQDVLGLGEKARMNRPFINEGNWLWALRRKQLKSRLATKLAMMTKLYRRI